jgi:hypothetical protein
MSEQIAGVALTCCAIFLLIIPQNADIILERFEIVIIQMKSVKYRHKVFAITHKWLKIIVSSLCIELVLVEILRNKQEK